MPCNHVKLPDGGHAIVCTGRQPAKRCEHCREPAHFQCDLKIESNWETGDIKRCDRYLCAAHAHPQEFEGKHLCPEHQAAYRRWLDEREQQQETEK